MDYSRLKKKLKLTGYSVKTISDEIGMTDAGLYKAINNNTLKIRDLESIATVLNVPINYFFEKNPSSEKSMNVGGDYNISSHKNNNNTYSEDCATYKAEIENLKARLKDKEEIIALLKQTK